MELLERIVGQDRGAGALSDLQDEGIAATDCASRWGEELTCEQRLFVLGALGLIDAIGKGRVHHHDDVGERVLPDELGHSIVELCERWRGSTFGCDVGPVDDELFL